MDRKIKRCKKHNKILTPEHNEFSSGFTGRLECTDCIDNLDFWLPMPSFVIIFFMSIFYIIFPIFPEMRYLIMFLLVSVSILFFAIESNIRVLKRLFKCQTLVI